MVVSGTGCSYSTKGQARDIELDQEIVANELSRFGMFSNEFQFLFVLAKGIESQGCGLVDAMKTLDDIFMVIIVRQDGQEGAKQLVSHEHIVVLDVSDQGDGDFERVRVGDFRLR